jgi:uncharacterized protein YkwD
MKLKILILLCWCLILENCVSSQFRWNFSNYQNFSYHTFSNYKPVNQKINSRNIDYSLLHAAIFFETNRQRVLFGLPVLKHSPALEKAALQHSKDMVRYNFFSHVSPVRGKKTLSDRLAKVGIDNAYKGENLATVCVMEYQSGKPVFTPPQNGGYFSYTHKGKPIVYRTYLTVAKTVVKHLMGSPGHRKNILTKEFKFLGVGATLFKDRKFHKMPYFKVTQNFASDRGN